MMHAGSRGIQAGPYLNFQGRAREAMELYRNVLGGTLDLDPVDGGRVRQARLEADGAVILATDGHPDYPARVGDHMAIALSGTDRARLAGIFQSLADGGNVLGPLAAQPGGAEAGWLRDRFGISWTIRIEQA